jgi:hypothetical protein
MNEEKLKIKQKEKNMLMEEVNMIMVEFEADNLKSTNKSALRRNRKRVKCLQDLLTKYKNISLEISKLLPKRKNTNENWKKNPMFYRKAKKNNN